MGRAPRSPRSTVPTSPRLSGRKLSSEAPPLPPAQLLERESAQTEGKKQQPARFRRYWVGADDSYGTTYSTFELEKELAPRLAPPDLAAGPRPLSPRRRFMAQCYGTTYTRFCMRDGLVTTYTTYGHTRKDGKVERPAGLFFA